MILILDNRDSFVFNIARYFEELGADCSVRASHEITLEEIQALEPDALVLSPGPCTPQEAGICLQAVKAFADVYPIMGVCLGHQCIAEAFGGDIVRSETPKYAQASDIRHTGEGLFEGLPSPLSMGLYHSLVVRQTERSCQVLKVNARSPSGEIMALAHRCKPIWGVQFHPESILSQQGYDIFANFLRLSGVRRLPASHEISRHQARK